MFLNVYCKILGIIKGTNYTESSVCDPKACTEAKPPCDVIIVLEIKLQEKFCGCF